MFIPKPFREERIDRLHEIIRAYSFATVVSILDGVPYTTHVPLLLDPERGPFGTLRGHFAAANPQWQVFDGRTQVLAIFQGPHAYVSPRWYAGTPNVPTWNYQAVHAYGPAATRDDPAWLDRMLDDLAETLESGQPDPWRPSELPDEYRTQLRGGIMGFEIEITRLEGKFKLGQNRTDEDRLSAAQALSGQNDPLARAVGSLMAEI